MIGSTVDKYEVLQKVGEGGMATVYRGRHTTLERDVAIKVLHPHLSSSTRNRRRFAREARAIEHLRHRNILEIFDYSGIESGDCYIVTEFVQGQTLAALLDAQGPLPSELVAQIGVALCEALAYAHARGVLHRDLKPENAMVRDDGTVKLMDFGIARFLDESQVTLTGALVGSPAFMSPEQAVEGALDARSDLFSLGSVLFHLSSGVLPFTGGNPSLILKNVIEGNRPGVAELVPTISPALADVIERLLCTDPSARFSSAGEVADALSAVWDEIGFGDDERARWSIRVFLEDPDGYRSRLAERVRQALLDRGRRRLDEGDPLGALRLFNRLLALDEGNEEVLSLLQSLHSEPAPARPPRRWIGWFALGVGVFGAMALGVWVAARPAASSTPRAPVPSSQPVQTTAPAEPVPAPEPPVQTAPESPAPDPPAPEPPDAVRALPVRPTPGQRVPSRALRTQDELARIAAPTPNGPARLRVVSNIPADVFHEGRKLGNTRSPIELEPGSYLLEVRSDVVLPYELRVDVGPGESLTREITVEARPAPVRVASTFDGSCEVALDGRSLGDLASLGWLIQVSHPDQPGHQVQVRCPDAAPFDHVWQGGVLPGEVVGP